MNNQCTKVGETAGKIYQALEKNGELKLEKIGKEVGVSDEALLNQAIGWLCREDKLHLEKKSLGTFLSLVTSSADSCCK